MMNPGSLEVQYLHEQLNAIYPRSNGFSPVEEHRMPTDESVWIQRDFFISQKGMTPEERRKQYEEIRESVFLPIARREAEIAAARAAAEKTALDIKKPMSEKKIFFSGSGIPIDKSKLFERKRFSSAENVMGKSKAEAQAATVAKPSVEKISGREALQFIARVIQVGVKIIDIKHAMEA